jgi:hypothetical protein
VEDRRFPHQTDGATPLSIRRLLRSDDTQSIRACSFLDHDTRSTPPWLMFRALGAASGAVSVDRDRSRSRLQKMTWYSGKNVAERVGVGPSYLVRLGDRAERLHS